MLCGGKERAIEYFNYMARALRVVTNCPVEYEELAAYTSIEDITIDVDNKLDDAFRQGEESLFNALLLMMNDIEDIKNTNRFLKARAIALWMDRQISYEPWNKEEVYSIASLVPFTDGNVVRMDSMNDNQSITSISIMPLLPAVKCLAPNDVDPEKPREKPLAASETLWGMNNELKNCRYRVDDKNITVEHIIFSWHKSNTEHSDYFRVAFTPMTNDAGLLVSEDATKEGIFGRKKEAQYKEPTRPEMLTDYFKEILKVASQSGKEFDLLFGPEMLGTDAMYQDDDGIVSFVDEAIRESGQDTMEQPKIIVLPSRTKDKTNKCLIVNERAELLGVQPKHYPYIDNRHHIEEAIDNKGKIHVVVIHVYEHERIVVMICKDFLKDKTPLYELIFRQINPTLVIVPSYTVGETDFIKNLPSVNKFGTSVVWGTCCGAPRANDPYIGAASVIGTEGIPKMADACTCGRRCDSDKACIFYIDIPTNLKDREIKPIKFEHLYT